MSRNRVRSVFLLLAVVAVMPLAACNSVQPWQRANLARPEMLFENDPLDSRFLQHIYFSKENASGGYGVGGGGCGCN